MEMVKCIHQVMREYGGFGDKALFCDVDNKQIVRPVITNEKGEHFLGDWCCNICKKKEKKIIDDKYNYENKLVRCCDCKKFGNKEEDSCDIDGKFKDGETKRMCKKFE